MTSGRIRGAGRSHDFRLAGGSKIQVPSNNLAPPIAAEKSPSLHPANTGTLLRVSVLRRPVQIIALFPNIFVKLDQV